MIKLIIVQYVINTKFLLQLAGDIESNPGPDDTTECPCEELQNCRLIKCCKCHQHYHTLCIGLDGITNGALEKLRNWYCPLCLTLPDSIKKKMIEKYAGNQNTENSLQRVMNTIKNVEKNILTEINKIDGSKQIETPFLTAAVKKLEKEVKQNSKHVRNINKSDDNNEKEKKIDLTRIVLKPIDKRIKNSPDLRKEFGKLFPNVHVPRALISAGGSFIFEFENEEDVEKIDNEWSKNFFGGNSGIIKMNNRNRIGIVKFVYLDYNEDEIINEIETNYPNVKHELFKKDGDFTGMIKITFNDEYELNTAIANKFNLFNRKFVTEPFKSKPRVIKCNVCQQFGHVSRRCRNTEKPVCGKCSQEGHETKDCKTRQEDHKCFHCHKNDHFTGSYKCQKMQEKLQILIDRRENGQ